MTEKLSRRSFLRGMGAAAAGLALRKNATEPELGIEAGFELDIPVSDVVVVEKEAIDETVEMCSDPVVFSLLADGSCFYVNPMSGDDDADGLAPSNAKATVQGAVQASAEHVMENPVILVWLGTEPGEYEGPACNGIMEIQGKMCRSVDGGLTWTQESEV